MIKNMKFLGYQFYTNTNIQGDFQICISVPLKEEQLTYLSEACNKPKFASTILSSFDFYVKQFMFFESHLENIYRVLKFES